MVLKKFLFSLASLISISSFSGCSNNTNLNLIDETKINYYGRVVKKSSSEIFFYNSLSGFELSFIGSELSATFNKGFGQYLRVYLDGSDAGSVQINKTTKLISNLEPIEHKIKVLRCNFEARGIVELSSIFGAEKYLKSPTKPQLKFEIYGDSITAGHEIYRDEDTRFDLSNEDATKAYAELVAEHFNGEVSALCCSGASLAIPSYIEDWVIADRFDQYSFTTNLDKWDFSNYVADFIIINLGTNDGFSINESNKEVLVTKYKEFLLNLRSKNVNAKIVCCYGMMGTVPLVDDSIKLVVNSLNDSKIYYKHLNRVELGINTFHPTIRGHKEGANELIGFIETIIDE